MYRKEYKSVERANQKRYNAKSIALTFLLVCFLIISIYLIIVVFISGPVNKYQSDYNKIVEKINTKEKDITNIYRHSFKYVTYVCESEKKYTVYDQNGKQIATRKKKDLQLDKVEKIVKEKYPTLNGVEIKVGYGKNNIAYVVEKDKTLLILDFDTLKKVFYMKEG